MNRKLYEMECLLRRPEFRQDRERLSQQHPRFFWALERWPTDETGRPILSFTEAEQKALQDFKTKYPFLELEHVSMVLQPFPLVFDPAWKVCLDKAVMEYTTQHGSAPAGLIMRSGVEGTREPGPESEEIYRRANADFDKLPEAAHADHRRAYAPEIFREARIVLPIGPTTRLDHLKHLWPLVERAQRACYGIPVKEKAARAGIHEGRLKAYDLIRVDGLSVAEAARRLGMNPRTVLRHYNEALRDIEGFTGRLTAERHQTHVAECPTCQDAEARGTAERYCDWMQRQLGSKVREREFTIQGQKTTQFSRRKWEVPFDEKKEESVRGREWRPSSAEGEEGSADEGKV